MKGLSAKQLKEWERLVGLVTDALSECATFRDDLVEQMDAHYEDRTEKWREGEQGDQFQQWKSCWEEVDFEGMIDDLNALPLTAEDA